MNMKKGGGDDEEWWKEVFGLKKLPFQIFESLFLLHICVNGPHVELK
jgi:hypothetical protein